ncbi:fatty-acyl-CoA synthase [Nocardiopsis terrae]|uniref:Acyl-CoA synthetase (AMP-forming)/AMP-acid ligase II n=1 Tax=Nocardiopsis terrae TaxID=372655 RepID=A0ABR9HPV9_9ACTN|nr:AMP-binding protein [Nocardiopsis terrae]MBE1460890.1 acyl-CoA synthetase (AMP-forming)/AMP-acid ligase II [Nocardiopsis terrae]GHC73965.1 fatty-acyl-CoA synthase [Nocardiopsis terrae]
MAAQTGSPPAPSKLRHTLRVVRVLVRAGVLAPGRPDRVVRQLRALRTWGATIAGGYAAAGERVPRQVSVIDDAGSTTFGQMNLLGRALARELHGMGAGQGTRVGILCRNHAGMVQTMVACGRLGADAVLLNTGLAAGPLVDVVEQNEISLLVADAEFEELCGGLPPELPRVTAWGESGAPGPRFPEGERGSDAVDPEPPERPGRLIVLTSGTTGTPKGARRPTPKGPQDAASVLSRIPLNSRDRILVSAPVFHTWGLAGVQLGMSMRASLVMRRLFEPEDVLRTIQEHRCTALFAVPVMLRRIMDLPRSTRDRYDTSSLRIVACSGSAMSPQLISDFMDVFGDVVYNLYGSTEVSWATIATPEDLRSAPTTAGRPPLGTRIAVLDEQGREVPQGSRGAIHVGNEMLFDGYTSGRSKRMADGLMETGDRGYVDVHGLLHVSGRDDDMIVSGGENVFPRPVEEAIVTMPAVREVVVTGVPDEEFGQRFAAYVVPYEGSSVDPNELRMHVREVLGRFSVPRDVVVLADLPRNATGKVVKRRLPSSVRARE